MILIAMVMMRTIVVAPFASPVAAMTSISVASSALRAMSNVTLGMRAQERDSYDYDDDDDGNDDENGDNACDGADDSYHRHTLCIPFGAGDQLHRSVLCIYRDV